MATTEVSIEHLLTSVGFFVGDSVGFFVGDSVGLLVGDCRHQPKLKGERLSDASRTRKGRIFTGVALTSVGFLVGDSVGFFVGDSVGFFVGLCRVEARRERKRMSDTSCV